MAVNRIWIDGCFDFAHHGHAGAMLQARQQGDELYVGVHSDEEILVNKGPCVMTLEERVAAVEGCRWCTECIPNAPYVTDYKVMDEYGCKYVVHGDDITTDKDGKDCYEEVKKMGRFIVVKRTPNISTTDVVGRMLSGDNKHHIKDINLELLSNEDCVERYRQYATDKTGKKPFANVWKYEADGRVKTVIEGEVFKNDDTIYYYVEGSFDLFHAGHIAFLRKLKTGMEGNEGRPVKVVVGIWSDQTVNGIAGNEVNYPIMNVFERSLCVLQSKYIDGLVLDAPRDTGRGSGREPFLGQIFPGEHQTVVGVSASVGVLPPAVAAIVVASAPQMSVGEVLARVVGQRAAFEERQRRKGVLKRAEEEKLQ